VYLKGRIMNLSWETPPGTTKGAPQPGDDLGGIPLLLDEGAVPDELLERCEDVRAKRETNGLAERDREI
jgi:hypothetical protein